MKKTSAPRRVGDPQSGGVLGLSAQVVTAALEVERHLSGDGEQLGGEPAGKAERRVERHGATRHLVRRQGVEDRVGAQDGMNPRGREQRECLPFPQMQQAGDGVHLATG